MRRRAAPSNASMRFGDRRTAILIETARELLAELDYEAFSIAELVRRAGCSIGAFYGRFQNKDQFLYAVIASTFGDAARRASDRLDLVAGGGRPGNAASDHIVQTIIDEMSDPATAGVTRAALKLSTAMPGASEPLLNYRQIISEKAAASVRGKDAKQRMREAVQIAFATMIDAIIQNPGPLKSGSPAMRRGLATMMANYLEAKRQ